MRFVEVCPAFSPPHAACYRQFQFHSIGMESPGSSAAMASAGGTAETAEVPEMEVMEVEVMEVEVKVEVAEVEATKAAEAAAEEAKAAEAEAAEAEAAEVARAARAPTCERDCPESRALVVRREHRRCEHRSGEQSSPDALETLREWALAHGCGGLEAGWRATTRTRHNDGPTNGQVDTYYYSPSGARPQLEPAANIAIISRGQVPMLLLTSGERLRSRLEVGRSAAPSPHNSFPYPLRANTTLY